MDANLERKQLTEQLFMNREYNISHPTYDSELEFYNMICNGDIETLKTFNIISDFLVLLVLFFVIFNISEYSSLEFSTIKAFSM